MNNDSKLLDERKTAERLGIKPETLRNWRSARRELPYIKVGGAVRYRLADIETYISEQTCSPMRIAH
jgi:predicted DNA-binding transcriptional regulator AlpA